MGNKRGSEGGTEGIEGDERGHVQARKVQGNARKTQDTRSFKTLSETTHKNRDKDTARKVKTLRSKETRHSDIIFS